jgi:type I restriction enzyme, S subunit
VSQLPPGWAFARLEDLASSEPRSITDGPFGSNLKTSHYTASGPRVIRLQNIGDFRFNEDQAHISEEHFERLRAHEVRPNDILIAGLGEHLPRACLAPASIGPAIVKADCFRVRLNPGVSPGYVCAALNSPQVRSAASQQISGVGRPRLNLQKVRDIRLAIPPAAEQERIVAAVEEHFSRIDAGIAALRRARQNLKQMRAALLRAAITGHLVEQDKSEGLGQALLHKMLTERPEKKPPSVCARYDMELPESWAVASLEAVTDSRRIICYGILKPRIKEAGVVPYVEVKDLRAKRLSVAMLHRTSQGLHEAFPRSILAAGDVVLAIRGSFDRALVVPDDVAGSNISRDVARIAPLPGLDSNFLVAYLTSPPALKYLRERARGVAVKGVNIADLRSMPIPLPPSAEQSRIIKELHRQLSILEGVLDTVEEADARSSRLRSSALAAAFSGKLVAQDSNDEPASRLLDRIAADRVRLNGQKRTPLGSPVQTRMELTE